jgi:hypothetical protein
MPLQDLNYFDETTPLHPGKRRGLEHIVRKPHRRGVREQERQRGKITLHHL